MGTLPLWCPGPGTLAFATNPIMEVPPGPPPPDLRTVGWSAANSGWWSHANSPRRARSALGAAPEPVRSTPGVTRGHAKQKKSKRQRQKGTKQKDSGQLPREAPPSEHTQQHERLGLRHRVQFLQVRQTPCPRTVPTVGTAQLALDLG